MTSTRRLLPDDEFERSDIKKSLIVNRNSRLEAVKEEEDPKSVGKVSSKGKAIKDIFGLQVDIDGVDDADGEDKYIFVEDKHAIGDMDLLENEAFKGEN